MTITYTISTTNATDGKTLANLATFIDESSREDVRDDLTASSIHFLLDILEPALRGDLAIAQESRIWTGEADGMQPWIGVANRMTQCAALIERIDERLEARWPTTPPAPTQGP